MYGIAKFQFLSEKQDLLFMFVRFYFICVSMIENWNSSTVNFPGKSTANIRCVVETHVAGYRWNLSFVYCSIVLSLKSDNVDMIQQLV